MQQWIKDVYFHMCTMKRANADDLYVLIISGIFNKVWLGNGETWNIYNNEVPDKKILKLKDALKNLTKNKLHL